MKSAIGWGLVTTLLLTAGCSSDNNNGPAGSGGRANAATGDAGTGGAMGSGGSYGGATGTALGGAAGSGAGGAGAGVGGGGGSGGAMVADASAGGAGGNGSGGAVVADAAPDGAGGTGVSDAGAGGSDGGATSFPPELAVPAGATLKSKYHGVGAQIYTCTASGGVDAGVDGGATTYAWVFKAPDAKLFDGANMQVGTHGAGPNWTSTVDGSVVNGTKVAQVDSPLATAIPWLLLRASSTSGTGMFSDITYVQRVNTSGGQAPATGCDAMTVSSEVRVDYTADYYFYTGGAGQAWLTPPANVPAILAVPAGATLKIHDHAIGAQIYTCTASGGVDAGTTTYAWVFKAPDAVLYDATFAQVGSHGAGPHWTSVDGSTVNGTKLQQASPSPDAVPWLLLKVSSASGSNGIFTDTTYVQRLNTAGGNAPASGCDSTTVNTDTRVNYSADYYFFTSGANDAGSAG